MNLFCYQTNLHFSKGTSLCLYSTSLCSCIMALLCTSHIWTSFDFSIKHFFGLLSTSRVLLILRIAPHCTSHSDCTSLALPQGSCFKFARGYQTTGQKSPPKPWEGCWPLERDGTSAWPGSQMWDRISVGL